MTETNEEMEAQYVRQDLELIRKLREVEDLFESFPYSSPSDYRWLGYDRSMFTNAIQQARNVVLARAGARILERAEAALNVARVALKKKVDAPNDESPPTDVCPDCGRKKGTVGTVVSSEYCPKWWAIRDPLAEADCNVARVVLEKEKQTSRTEENKLG